MEKEVIIVGRLIKEVEISITRFKSHYALIYLETSVNNKNCIIPIEAWNEFADIASNLGVNSIISCKCKIKTNNLVNKHIVTKIVIIEKILKSKLV